MASTFTVCEVQAMYVANPRELCHLHASHTRLTTGERA